MRMPLGGAQPKLVAGDGMMNLITQIDKPQKGSSHLTRSSWRALGWILASIIGWSLALIANQFLGYFAPFNPFTAGGFAVGTLVTGSLFGLIVSLPQSIALRRGGPLALRWVIFSTLGFSMAFFVGNSLAKIFPALETPIGYLIQGSAMGLWIGVGHWLASGRYVNRSFLWATISGAAWAASFVIGGLIESLVLVGGGLLYGVVTAYPFVVLIAGRDRARPDASSA